MMFTHNATLSGPSEAPPVIEKFSISAQQCLVVGLEFNDRHSAKKVAAAEYRLTLGLLGLSQLEAARLLGMTGRSSRRYACGEHAVPEEVMARLWSWVRVIMELPEEVQPRAYAAIWKLSESKQEPWRPPHAASTRALR
jgi:hypothetical protein